MTSPIAHFAHKIPQICPKKHSCSFQMPSHGPRGPNLAQIWAQNVASIFAFEFKWVKHSSPKWPNNIWHIASTWPTIARLCFNITHKIAKLGPKIAPIWLPASEVAPKIHSCSFQMHVVVSQLTTSPQARQFFEPNYIYLRTNFSGYPPKKSCGVGGGRREASLIV